MNVNTFYNYCNYISAKERSGRTFTPDEFNFIVVPAAQYSFILQEIKQWQTITEDIRVLKKTVTLSPVSGIASLPTDYMMFETGIRKYVTSLSIPATTTVINNCGEEVKKDILIPVEYVGQDEFAQRTIAAIREPNLDFPIVKFDAGTIEFLPQVTTALFTYLKQPVSPFWNFTIDTTTETPVFNPVGSIDIEFPEHTRVKLAMHVLSQVGINLTYPALTQYAEAMKVQ